MYTITLNRLLKTTDNERLPDHDLFEFANLLTSSIKD